MSWAVLIAIAMALDTTTDFLVGLSDDVKRLTERERAVVAAMRGESVRQ